MKRQDSVFNNFFFFKELWYSYCVIMVVHRMGQAKNTPGQPTKAERGCATKEEMAVFFCISACHLQRQKREACCFYCYLCSQSWKENWRSDIFSNNPFTSCTKGYQHRQTRHLFAFFASLVHLCKNHYISMPE